MPDASPADPQSVVDVLTHPEVWPHVADDWSPKPSDWNPSVGISLQMCDENGVAGIATFMPMTWNLWHSHVAFLPGKADYGMAEAALEWMAVHTPATCLIATVPDDNKPAQMFAAGLGFRKVGRLPKSFQRNGELHSSTLFQMALRERLDS